MNQVQQAYQQIWEKEEVSLEELSYDEWAEIVMTHPLFKPLHSLAVYKEFALDGWTISWSNGTIDLAPEYLYEHSVA